MMKKLKLTRAEAEQLAKKTDCCMNYFWRDGYPKLKAARIKIQGDSGTDFLTFYDKMTEGIRNGNLGRPQFVFRDMESEPGFWAFQDEETKVIMILWTDTHRKNAWKGSSIEFVRDENSLNDDNLSIAYQRFCELVTKE